MAIFIVFIRPASDRSHRRAWSQRAQFVYMHLSGCSHLSVLKVHAQRQYDRPTVASTTTTTPFHATTARIYYNLLCNSVRSWSVTSFLRFDTFGFFCLDLWFVKKEDARAGEKVITHVLAIRHCVFSFVACNTCECGNNLTVLACSCHMSRIYTTDKNKYCIFIQIKWIRLWTFSSKNAKSSELQFHNKSV